MVEVEGIREQGAGSDAAGSGQSGSIASRSNGAPHQERVFRSSDKMLYLAGGSNGAAALYTDWGFKNSVDTQAWKSLFIQRASSIRFSGSRFAQLIVPEKLTVYPLSEHDRQILFPGLGELNIVSPGRRLLSEMEDAGIFYPDGFLREQRLAMPIYLPTDSHWTWQGAFSAFQFLMWSLGYRPDYNKFVSLPKNHLRFKGDLWEAEFVDVEPDCFERFICPQSIKRIYANPVVGLKEKMGLDDEQGLHMGSHCIFSNRDAEFQETVVLFGSSYSECRLDPSLLTLIFAYYFETVHFIWSASVDLEYVNRHRPNLTVSEIPERFLTLRPNDAVRVEEFGVDRVLQWKKRNPL